MTLDDLLERIPQRIDPAQAQEDGGLEAVANWLRSCNTAGLDELARRQLLSSPHKLNGTESLIAEAFAMRCGLWIDDPQSLGFIGPCGDENYCYFSRDGLQVFKVNVLTHSGGRILPVFDKLLIHNRFFPETRYRFVGLTNMQFARTAFPIFSQTYVRDAHNATDSQIADYMHHLGFTPRTEKKGAWQQDDILIWDMLPKNVLIDNDGEFYVIDAECQRVGGKISV